MENKKGCDHCREHGNGRGQVSFTGRAIDLVTEDDWEAVGAWATARSGFLPDAGGFNDQTPWFQQAFRHCQALSGLHEKKQADEIKRDANRKTSQADARKRR